MTTGTWLRPADERSTVFTKLPRPGSVIVRATEPPVTPDAACADVRPGHVAVLDGDRRRGTLHVECAADRWSVPTCDLPALEAAVDAALGGDRAAVVRFGDRAACRGLVPAPTVAAIERRLLAAAEGTRATLLTWASESPGDADRRTYDVVVDGPAAGEG